MKMQGQSMSGSASVSGLKREVHELGCFALSEKKGVNFSSRIMRSNAIKRLPNFFANRNVKQILLNLNENLLLSKNDALRARNIGLLGELYNSNNKQDYKKILLPYRSTRHDEIPLYKLGNFKSCAPRYFNNNFRRKRLMHKLPSSVLRISKCTLKPLNTPDKDIDVNKNLLATGSRSCIRSVRASNGRKLCSSSLSSITASSRGARCKTANKSYMNIVSPVIMHCRK
eukprot:TRINITY_DN9630_c0_g6_i1.p1 TRINITY_DN9630_c0_g6~~TRINITY_DN9630_c0_g6_i1.p1  ORF type:complete len:228 (-),score=32.83 TRINITY_DN9630_c0_g6_i1:61-744(-)